MYCFPPKACCFIWAYPWQACKYVRLRQMSTAKPCNTEHHLAEQLVCNETYRPMADSYPAKWACTPSRTGLLCNPSDQKHNIPVDLMDMQSGRGGKFRASCRLDTVAGYCPIHAALEMMLQVWVAAYQRCACHSKIQVHAHQSSHSSSECERQGDHSQNLHKHTVSWLGGVFQATGPCPLPG